MCVYVCVCVCMCMALCHFNTHIDLCSHYSIKMTGLFYHHKDFPHATPLYYAHPPLPTSSNLWNPPISLHLYNFVFLRILSKWNHRMCPYETGFLHLAQCPWDPTKLLHVSVFIAIWVFLKITLAAFLNINRLCSHFH